MSDTVSERLRKLFNLHTHTHTRPSKRCRGRHDWKAIKRRKPNRGSTKKRDIDLMAGRVFATWAFSGDDRT